MSEPMIVCDRCGAANEPAARFCWSCGASLTGAASPPGSPPPTNHDAAPEANPWMEPAPRVGGEPSADGGSSAEPNTTTPPPTAGPADHTAGGEAPLPPRSFGRAAGTRAGRRPGGTIAGLQPRSIILIGLVLLLLSCLWFIVALVSKLTIWFSLLCLLPLGVIAVVIGVVLMFGKSTRRRF